MHAIMTTQWQPSYVQKCEMHEMGIFAYSQWTIEYQVLGSKDQTNILNVNN